MLKFDNVSKIFTGNFKALDKVNLDIQEGDFVSIVGESGSGKSTLLKLVYAEEQPSEGLVYFHKKPIQNIKRRHLPYYRRNIGTIFQDYKLLPQKTIFENVAYALEVLGETNAEINDKVPQILDIVGMADKMEKYPHQLSGGEQQKISIARALIHAPQVIIADEPTGNLDPKSTWEIIQLLLKINEYATTVLLATHDKNMVDSLQKRVVTLHQGKLVGDEVRGKYKMRN